MEINKDIIWFKNNLEPVFEGYEIKYKFYNEGDFGSLNQIEFNSKIKGGNIDFWGLGWLGIFIWDYDKEEEIMNILLEPNQKQQQLEAFEKLKEIL